MCLKYKKVYIYKGGRANEYKCSLVPFLYVIIKIPVVVEGLQGKENYKLRERGKKNYE